MDAIYLNSLLRFLWQYTTGLAAYQVFLAKLAAFFTGVQVGNRVWRLNEGAASNLQDLTEVQLLNILLGTPNELIADIIGPVPIISDGTIAQWFVDGDVPRDATPAVKMFFFCTTIVSGFRLAIFLARNGAARLRELQTHAAVLAEFSTPARALPFPQRSSSPVPLGQNPRWWMTGTQPQGRFYVVTSTGTRVLVTANASEPRLLELIRASRTGALNGVRFGDTFYTWVSSFPEVKLALPGQTLESPLAVMTVQGGTLTITYYEGTPAPPRPVSAVPVPSPSSAEIGSVLVRRLVALRTQLLGLASTAERLAFYNSLGPAEREALRRFLPPEVLQELSTFEVQVTNAELLAAINRRLAQSEREILAMGGRPLGTPAAPVARGFRSLPRSVGELGGDILAGLRHAPLPTAIYAVIASELEGQYLRYTWEEMQAYLNGGQGLPVFATNVGPPVGEGVPLHNTLGGYWIWPARWPGRVQSLWYQASQMALPSYGLDYPALYYAPKPFVENPSWLEISRHAQELTLPIFLRLLQAEIGRPGQFPFPTPAAPGPGGSGLTPEQVQAEIDRGAAFRLPATIRRVPVPGPRLPFAFSLTEGVPIPEGASFPTYYFSPFGESVMSQLSGKVEYNALGWGGWSEQVFSYVPSETFPSMLAKMVRWLEYRMGLSIGPDSTGCSNPVVPYAIVIKDQINLRLTQTNYCIQPAIMTGQVQAPVGANIAIPAGFGAGTNNNLSVPQNQNLDIELGARVKFSSGGPGQIATPMFHGMPLAAMAGTTPGGAAGVLVGVYGSAFLRTGSPSGQWLGNLSALTQFMALNGLGYRNITGAWNTGTNRPGQGCAPDAWYYNATEEFIELQWKTATFPAGAVFTLQNPANGVVAPGFPASLINPGPPVLSQVPPIWPLVGSQCRLQVRGWKNFPVLNGRWAAQVVAPYSLGNAPNPYTSVTGPFQFAIRIKRQCRQPLSGSVPNVSPIGWSYYYPGQVSGAPILPTPSPTLVSQPPGTPPPGGGTWNQFFASVGAYQYIESKKLGRFFGAERGRQRNRAA